MKMPSARFSARRIFVAGRSRSLEHEGLDRLDAADLVEEFLADLAGLRGAQHHDVAVAGALHEPAHRIEIAVAAAHQQQAGLHLARRFCGGVADHVVAVVRCLCCQGEGQE
jgi:hypothetical protein